jgi:hypothetical protein
MARNTLMTLLLIIASLLLAVALFIAGAMWRGRATARTSAVESRKPIVNPLTDQIARKTWTKTSRIGDPKLMVSPVRVHVGSEQTRRELTGFGQHYAVTRGQRALSSLANLCQVGLRIPSG